MREEPSTKLENIEPQKSPETELSPEVLEKAMAKVQDIDKKGTGYKGLWHEESKENAKKLKSILVDGVMGFGEIHGHEHDKHGWVKESRERSKKYGYPLNYFNIVGRSGINEGVGKPEIMFVEYPAESEYTILFSLDNFQQVRPHFRQHAAHALRETKRRSYASFMGRDVAIGYGFVTRARIAPRFFTGIIVGRPVTFVGKEKPPDGKFLYFRGGYWTYDYTSAGEDELVRRMGLAVQANWETNKDKPENLLPIYTIEGNLVWPKKMNYEEVKKFVAERDEKKVVASKPRL